MINYLIDDKGVFSVSFKGFISVWDIEHFVETLKEMNHLPDDLVALYDLTEAVLEINMDELDLLTQKVINATDRFSSVRAAFIVGEPDLTATSILFKQANPKISTTREVFSTREAGFEWLLF